MKDDLLLLRIRNLCTDNLFSQVNGNWQSKGGPAGVAGCFAWNIPDDQNEKPDPEILYDETVKNNNDSPNDDLKPKCDEDKFGIRLSVKVNDEKKVLDKDHIYVGNQKIYRTCRTPDLQSKIKNVPEIKDEGNTSRDMFRERSIFADENEALKVRIKNFKIEQSPEEEVGERFDKLGITGEAIRTHLAQHKETESVLTPETKTTR